MNLYFLNELNEWAGSFAILRNSESKKYWKVRDATQASKFKMH